MISQVSLPARRDFDTRGYLKLEDLRIDWQIRSFLVEIPGQNGLIESGHSQLPNLVLGRDHELDLRIGEAVDQRFRRDTCAIRHRIEPDIAELVDGADSSMSALYSVATRPHAR